MIFLYVNALLCTLQHIVIHAMQLSGVNSPNVGVYCRVACNDNYSTPTITIFIERDLVYSEL